MPTTGLNTPAGSLRVTLRCLLFGSLLFAAERAWSVWSGASRPVSRRIEISAAKLDQLRREAALPLAVDGDAERALVDAAVEDEILYREGLRRGLDRDDPVVQRRLVQLMLGFAAQEGASDAELHAQALALGLDRDDIVVRRRLVQRLRLAIESGARDEGVDDASLRAVFERDRERYRQPEQVRLSHVFLDRRRRGERVDADAEAALESLRAGAPAGARGDPFPLSTEVPPSSQQALAQSFGEDFARAVFALPLRQWSGPVPSAFGLHVVWVDERIPAADLPFEAVRDQVRRGIMDGRARGAVRDAVAAWREQYEVVLPAK